MSGVEFDDGQQSQSHLIRPQQANVAASHERGVIGLMKKIGIKEPKHINIVLGIITVIIAGAAIVIFFWPQISNRLPGFKNQTYREDLREYEKNFGIDIPDEIVNRAPSKYEKK